MCSCPDYKVQGVCRGACSAKQGLFPKTGCKLRKERKAPKSEQESNLDVLICAWAKSLGKVPALAVEEFFLSFNTSTLV